MRDKTCLAKCNISSRKAGLDRVGFVKPLHMPELKETAPTSTHTHVHCCLLFWDARVIDSGDALIFWTPDHAEISEVHPARQQETDRRERERERGRRTGT